MSFEAGKISYKETNSFSGLVIDYLSADPLLKDFYQHPPALNGIIEAIEERKKFSVNRNLLVQELKRRYEELDLPEKLCCNLDALLNENCFTVCTAHQPNIFTGHLYFVYKIIHAVKLADELNAALSAYHFVPVYYMGSEDADLGELGEIQVNGKKYTWNTAQTGAVGRMQIDKEFLALIDGLDAQLAVEKHGKEIIAALRKFYSAGKTIEQATFEFVHYLFGEYGLVILLPDTAAWKVSFAPVIQKELREQFSKKAVNETLASFPAAYKVQVEGRNINLFYLKDNTRERIEKKGDDFVVANNSVKFSEEEILKELELHPERFSPNVILRPLLQETVLPNVAFIGGGGEIAYWLELKKVFESCGVPFPVLILRNSFMVISQETAERIAKLGFKQNDFFKSSQQLLNEIVARRSKHKLNLEQEKAAINAAYQQVSNDATAIDITLQKHVTSLQKKALHRMEELEKKMLRAEKKKFEAEQRQLQKTREQLFPGGTLQERVNNLLPYYAVYGKEFISSVYQASSGLDQQFTLLTEKQ